MNSYAIMAREMAPGSATQSMYVDETVSSTEGMLHTFSSCQRLTQS